MVAVLGHITGQAVRHLLQAVEFLGLAEVVWAAMPVVVAGGVPYLFTRKTVGWEVALVQPGANKHHRLRDRLVNFPSSSCCVEPRSP